MLATASAIVLSAATLFPASAPVRAPAQAPAPDVQVATVEHDFQDWLHAWEMSQVDTYVHAVQMADVETYVNAVAEADFVEAQRAAQQTHEAPATAPRATSDDGSCYGGPIPDYIVDRESGGNPSADNPSGAFGCYQIMPEWWSGACAAYDRYTISGQKQCAALIWQDGAGSSNWALTR